MRSSVQFSSSNQDRLSPANTAGKGAQIADALIARAGKDQRLRLQLMSMAEAIDRLDSGSVYGALVIPPDGIFDTAVGHAFGEAHASLTYRSPVAISRTRLFLAKCAASAALGPVAATTIASACLLLGVGTPHAALLWVFTSAAIAAVGIGQQALVAAFGSLASLLGTFIFMALALPSSGGTVPLQAPPSFFRFLSLFEPGAATQVFTGPTPGPSSGPRPAHTASPPA